MITTWIKNKIKDRGFTLIEVLISLFGFALILGVVSAAAVNIIDLQRRGTGAQKVQENAMYMLELMAREIRIGKIENQDASGCTATTLSMVHPVNGNIGYSYDEVNKRVVRTDDGVNTYLSASDVEVTRLYFCIFGSNPTDSNSVRVAIIMQIQNKAVKESNVVTFDLQTTVTSRDINSEYLN